MGQPYNKGWNGAAGHIGKGTEMAKTYSAAVQNPIEADFQAEILQKDAGRVAGPVAGVARQYIVESPRLLGLLLKLNYEEMHHTVRRLQSASVRTM
jgi:hypothetical protein